jgi:hypothetical protein
MNVNAAALLQFVIMMQLSPSSAQGEPTIFLDVRYDLAKCRHVSPSVGMCHLRVLLQSRTESAAQNLLRYLSIAVVFGTHATVNSALNLRRHFLHDQFYHIDHTETGDGEMTFALPLTTSI